MFHHITKPTKPIIILGMHRSGTSCLAGTLEQAGVCLGKVSTNNQFNKKGNREHSDVMQLNNDLLQFNHGSWDKPPNQIKWNENHVRQGNELVTLFEKNCKTKYWGFN